MPAKPSPQLTRYQTLRAQQRCVECGAQDAQTLAGRARCQPCAATNSRRTLARQEASGRFRPWRPGGPGRPPATARNS